MYTQNVTNLMSAKTGPCPVCQGNEFEWGRLGRQVYYVPGESLWTMRGYQYIRARRCLQCNNLTSFTDSELTRKQWQVILPIIIIAVVLGLLGILLPLLSAVPR